MGFPQILSAYYVWNVLGLNYHIFESKYLFNSTGPHDVHALMTILSQDNFDISFLAETQTKQIGIACACTKDNSYACLIATADQAPTRDIKERVPLYQSFLGDNEKCYQKCNYLKGVPSWYYSFSSTNDCSILRPDGVLVKKFIDKQGFCKSCSDFMPHCTDCLMD